MAEYDDRGSVAHVKCSFQVGSNATIEIQARDACSCQQSTGDVDT